MWYYNLIYYMHIHTKWIHVINIIECFLETFDFNNGLPLPPNNYFFLDTLKDQWKIMLYFLTSANCHTISLVSWSFIWTGTSKTESGSRCTAGLSQAAYCERKREWKVGSGAKIVTTITKQQERKVNQRNWGKEENGDLQTEKASLERKVKEISWGFIALHYASFMDCLSHRNYL